MYVQHYVQHDMRPSLKFQCLADRTARSMIGSWHRNIVCLSVCLSVSL